MIHLLSQTPRQLRVINTYSGASPRAPNSKWVTGHGEGRAQITGIAEAAGCS